MRRGGAANAVALAANVGTSVLIVFANKLVMDERSGHGFTFATTLCALHFLACAAAVWAAQAAGLAARASIPARDALRFAAVASVSVASLNLSLLVNSVGAYQVAKLLIIPCVAVAEAALLGQAVSLRAALSIAAVVCGVAVVAVNDGVAVNPLGLGVAALAVSSSAAQQIMCGALQRRHALSSHQLLSNTAHLQVRALRHAGRATAAAAPPRARRRRG
ncbi:URGT3 [Scenedesmus sp. PABB004]|nr:URGT3 [Scenedesmus sp. PABB004]